MKPFLNKNSFAKFFLIVVSIWAISCNKEEVGNNPTRNTSVADKNVNLELLAKAFSVSMNQSVEFRNLIKQEALTKFDYQYDVLYSVIKDKRIGNNTVHELVSSNFKSLSKEIDIDTAIESIPYLQLSIPVKINDWNPSEYSPTIAFLPVDSDESNLKVLSAFDSYGNKTEISATEKPEITTLVLSQAERVDKDGKLTVNRDGIIIDESSRITIKQALQETQLKSAQIADKGSSVISVVSNDEFKKIEEEAILKQKQETLKEKALQDYMGKLTRNYLKSASTYERIQLTGFSNQPRTITMSWNNPTNKTCTYKIYSYEVVETWIEDAYGGYYTYEGQNLLVATTNSMNYSYTCPAAQVFNLYIEAWADGEIQTVSNYLTINASDRRQGTQEQVSRVIVSADRARQLEGWYAQDLEFEIKISMTGNGDTDSKLGDVPGIGFGINTSCNFWGLQQTDRSGPWNLFQWQRGDYSGVSTDGSIYRRNNGVYTIAWLENDRDSKNVGFQVAKKVVQLAAASFGMDPALTESIIQIGTVGFDVDTSDEQICQYDVTWWTPRYTQYNPAWGFVVYHTFDN